MIEKNELPAPPALLSRRRWLAKSFKTAAALGLGAFALDSLGGLRPSIGRAMEKMTGGALDFVAADTCTLTCTTTLGPCFANVNLVRRDITGGVAGLPMRFGFRVVNADTCQPLEGAAVEIWHANRDGNYSALTGVCTADQTTVSQTFLRGIQTTDAAGWAYFDSIFPGWYAGRVTHIHLTVRIGSTNIVTTQFFVADRVAELVYRNHPSYVHRPSRDTTNITDNVIGGNISRALPYILTTKMVQNKYLRAVKTIAVRTTPTACAA